LRDDPYLKRRRQYLLLRQIEFQKPIYQSHFQAHQSKSHRTHESPLFEYPLTPPGLSFFLRDLRIPVFCSYCLLWRWIDMEGFYFLPIHFYLNRSTSVVTIQKRISWLSTTQLVGCHIPCRQQLLQSPVWSPTSQSSLMAEPLPRRIVP
jgi:hypothetical protein